MKWNLVWIIVSQLNGGIASRADVQFFNRLSDCQHVAARLNTVIHYTYIPGENRTVDRFECHDANTDRPVMSNDH